MSHCSLKAFIDLAKSGLSNIALPATITLAPAFITSVTLSILMPPSTSSSQWGLYVL